MTGAIKHEHGQDNRPQSKEDADAFKADDAGF
jgi:hypothetical protein